MPPCTPEKYECLMSIDFEYEECINQCSGVLVTSYDQNKFLKLSEYMSKESGDFKDIANEFKGLNF